MVAGRHPARARPGQRIRFHDCSRRRVFTPLAVNGSYALWLKDGDILIARSASGHVVAILAHGHGPARNLFTLPGREQLVTLIAH